MNPGRIILRNLKQSEGIAYGHLCAVHATETTIDGVPCVRVRRRSARDGGPRGRLRAGARGDGGRGGPRRRPGRVGHPHPGRLRRGGPRGSRGATPRGAGRRARAPGRRTRARGRQLPRDRLEAAVQHVLPPAVQAAVPRRAGRRPRRRQPERRVPRVAHEQPRRHRLPARVDLLRQPDGPDGGGLPRVLRGRPDRSASSSSTSRASRRWTESASRRVARRVTAEGRHVIVFKAGKTRARRRGRRAATRRLSPATMRSRKRSSRARASSSRSTLDMFEDYTKVYTMLGDRLPAGRRLAVLSNAGFECAAVLDKLYGLTPAALAETTLARLRACLPAIAHADEPVDATPMADTARVRRSGGGASRRRRGGCPSRVADPGHAVARHPRAGSVRGALREPLLEGLARAGAAAALPRDAESRSS